MYWYDLQRHTVGRAAVAGPGPTVSEESPPDPVERVREMVTMATTLATLQADRLPHNHSNTILSFKHKNRIHSIIPFPAHLFYQGHGLVEQMQPRDAVSDRGRGGEGDQHGVNPNWIAVDSSE